MNALACLPRLGGAGQAAFSRPAGRLRRCDIRCAPGIRDNINAYPPRLMPSFSGLLAMPLQSELKESPSLEERQ